MPALYKEQCISTPIKAALPIDVEKRGKGGYDGTVYSFLLSSAWHLIETVDHIGSNLALTEKWQCFL